MVSFGLRSKAKDNTGRQTEVVLRGTEKASLHIVCFGADCQDADDLVVKAAAQRSRHGCVTGGEALSRVHVADAEHGFSERAELSDGKRQPWTKHHIRFMSGYGRPNRPIRREFHVALLAIVGAEVRDDA